MIWSKTSTTRSMVSTPTNISEAHGKWFDQYGTPDISREDSCSCHLATPRRVGNVFHELESFSVRRKISEPLCHREPHRGRCEGRPQLDDQTQTERLRYGRLSIQFGCLRRASLRRRLLAARNRLQKYAGSDSQPESGGQVSGVKNTILKIRKHQM